MQTILSEKQIELLQLNHIDFQQFVETSKKTVSICQTKSQTL